MRIHHRGPGGSRFRFARVVRRGFATPANRTGRNPSDGLSAVYGDTDLPLFEETLGSSWSKVVKKHGDRQALVSKHEPNSQHGRTPSSSNERDCLRWTFRAMDEHVDALARGLLGAGVRSVLSRSWADDKVSADTSTCRQGDRVAIYSQNNSAYAALQWATAKIGAILTSAYGQPSPGFQD